MIGLVKALVLILIMVALSLIFVAIHFEKKYFNNGYCLYCGTYMRHFDTDSQGGRGYTCDNCNYHTWVSYPNVDKEYRKEKGKGKVK